MTKVPDVGQTDAHLLTDIWTNGKTTTYHFEWGTAPNQLSSALSGPSRASKIHFQAIAAGTSETTWGRNTAVS